MSGGTTFHFVTDGIYAAFERAKDAAKDKDVPIARRRRDHSATLRAKAHKRPASHIPSRAQSMLGSGALAFRTALS
jgi:hypothetical protein